jgi:hypothetical protein
VSALRTHPTRRRSSSSPIRTAGSPAPPNLGLAPAHAATRTPSPRSLRAAGFRLRTWTGTRRMVAWLGHDRRSPWTSGGRSPGGFWELQSWRRRRLRLRRGWRDQSWRSWLLYESEYVRGPSLHFIPDAATQPRAQTAQEVVSLREKIHQPTAGLPEATGK